MEEPKKYRNDGMPIYEKIPKEEAKEAAEVWGEGNEPLTKLLENLITNGVQTLACCAGHEGENNPYIFLNAKDSKTIKLIEKMYEDPSLNSMCFLKAFKGLDNRICLCPTMENRNEFFNKINETFNEIINSKPEGKRQETIISKIIDLNGMHEDISYFSYSNEFSIGDVDTREIDGYEVPIEHCINPEEMEKTYIPILEREAEKRYQRRRRYGRRIYL